MIEYLIDPFACFLLILAVAGIFYFRSNYKWLRLVLVVAGGWLLFITTPLIPSMILGSLENRYSPVSKLQLQELRARQVHILVLGGGHSNDERLPATIQLSGGAVRRLAEGLRIWNVLPEAVLIFSGHSSSGRTTQAEMLAAAGEMLGLPSDAYLLQSEPANTWQEAQAYRGFIDEWRTENPGSVDPVLILISSARHMPRAMAMFEHLDLEPIPSPAEYRLFHDLDRPFQFRRYLPSTRNIDNLRVALREYAGLAQFHQFLKS